MKRTYQPSQVRRNIKERMVSVQEWQPKVVVKFFLAEEQKVERYYPHRNHQHW